MPVERRPTPEERYLEKKRAELSVLETQLAERELELHTLRGGLLSFEKQYDAVVKQRYEQLDELKMRIAELLPPERVADASADASAAQAAPEANPQAAAASARPRPPRRPAPAKPKEKEKEKSDAAAPAPAAAPAADRPPADFNPAESLKRLYRDIAKAMHPDLADSEENRAHRHQFMIRANEAYEAGDENRLLKVFQEWESAPESVKGIGPAADLIRCIRKIAWCEERLIKIDEELQEMQTSGLFGMKLMAEEAAQFERDLLAEMTARLDTEIEAAKEYLARLEAANPAPPAPQSTEPAPDFTTPSD